MSSPRGAALRSLHEETANKDLTIAELRLQVAELQPAQQEVLALRRQLELLDERIRGRDSETHARVGEMSAKLELHESVEEQLERQLPVSQAWCLGSGLRAILRQCGRHR